MAVKDVKIYTGAAEGWVSIGDLSQASLPISSTNGSVVLKESSSKFVVETNSVDQLTVSSTDISASSTYKPATENSLTTKRYVDQITGSNVEDMPFGGRNTEWKERSITVNEYVDGQPVLYKSIFKELVAANGIFSDGLHWTADGITWYSSGRDKTAGDLHVLPDSEYKVCDASAISGIGLYVTGKSYSADMKSWFYITGRQATYPFALGSSVYANQGTVKLASGGSTGLQWIQNPDSVIDQDGYIGGQPRDVATGSDGTAVAISASGEAFWGVDFGGVSWQKIDGPTDCRSCVWHERLQRFIFLSRNKWWCSTNTIPIQGMKTGDLPVTEYWQRLCDDGGSVTAMCPTAGKNTVLTCETYSEADFNANGLTWIKTGDGIFKGSLNNRGYKGLAGTNGRTIASMVGVPEGSQSTDYSVKYYYSVAGENRDLGVFTDDVQLINAVGIRSVIDTSDLKTQEDANQYFDGRLDNAGNLPLGAKDAGGVWATGTIGKALEDISKAEGPAGDDGKGWTGGSYDGGTGIVTFTSDDGLGFTTGDLRGSNGTNGTNGTDGTDGTSVDLTTVGVAMTDCDLAPADANGSFTADGTDPDGTKKYKLDLNLPRGAVCTASDSEPPSAGRCVGDLWLDTST